MPEATRTLGRFGPEVAFDVWMFREHMSVVSSELTSLLNLQNPPPSQRVNPKVLCVR